MRTSTGTRFGANNGTQVWPVPVRTQVWPNKWPNKWLVAFAKAKDVAPGAEQTRTLGFGTTCSGHTPCTFE